MKRLKNLLLLETFIDLIDDRESNLNKAYSGSKSKSNAEITLKKSNGLIDILLNNKKVGSLGIGIQGTINNLHNKNYTNSALLQGGFIIDPEFRYTGIGYKVIKLLFDFLNVDRLLIEVDSKQGSLDFWKKCGGIVDFNKDTYYLIRIESTISEAIKRVDYSALLKGISAPQETNSAPQGNLSGETGFSDTKGFTGYSGWKDGKLVYIGTTIQKPSDRFRWHKHNGKALAFKIEKQFDDADKMLDWEFEMIKKHKPQMNQITHRKQNLNKRLTPEDLEARKNNKQWCQSCLKRRINPGYSTCYYCNNPSKKHH